MAETLTADQDVRARLRGYGPDALTPIETLTVLLGEKSLAPAARLLAAFGSLTALVRATPAELARWVSEERAGRLDDGQTRALVNAPPPRSQTSGSPSKPPQTLSPLRCAIGFLSAP